MLVEASALATSAGFATSAVVSYAAPRLVRRRAVVFRRFVAAAAAVGGATSGAAPTGTGGVDLVLTAAVAAGITLLAARARPWTVAGAAVALAGVSATSDAAPLAFAAAGAAVAAALTARRAPALTVAVGALVVNAALRLELPGVHGLETLAGVAACLPLTVSGYRRLQRQARRRLGRAVPFGVAVVAAAGGVGVLAAAAARPALERAVDAADAGLDAAREGDQDGARSQLATASEQFDRADGALNGWWSLPGRAVPVLAQHLRALGTAAANGERLAEAGASVASATDLDGIEVTDGAIPLEPIASLAGPVARARAGAEAALVELRGSRSPWLVGPVADPLQSNLSRLADAASSLRTSEEVLRVLPGLLGADGPRRWFLAVQTPVEARAAGGFIGNFGEIVADGGRVNLTRLGRTAELNAGGAAAKRLVAPADYLARYGRFDVASTWQNITMSPDFPSVAQAIAGLYPQSGGTPVEGVIAIDPVGLAALLELTGPVRVPGWPTELSADNAAKVLLYEQYVAYGDEASSERADFLGEVARTVWSRLTSGRMPPPTEMVAALGPAVAGKHLMVASLDEGENRALRRAGINGEMAPVAGDALAVTTQNATGSKIEWFLRREIHYEGTFDPATGEVASTARVVLHNTAPPAGLPDYLIRNSAGLPPGTNRLYLSVYSPLLLTRATVGGEAVPVESETELGRNVYSTYVDLGPGGTVEVELSLAGAIGGDGYRLDLHAQPLVNPDRVQVEMERAGRSPVVRTLVLHGDETIRAR